MAEPELKAREPSFTFVHDAFSPDTTCIGKPLDDLYRRFNFELCRAIDMTKLSCVLGEMVERGWMDGRLAELFHLQASTLLAQLTSENNRALGALRSRIDGELYR